MLAAHEIGWHRNFDSVAEFDRALAPLLPAKKVISMR